MNFVKLGDFSSLKSPRTLTHLLILPILNHGGKSSELVFASELALALALMCLVGNVYGVSTSILSRNGYIVVGDDEEVQIFYYFIESQGNSSRDPLLLWVDGGPGCCSFSGFFYESGQLIFDARNYYRSINILCLDGPVGMGFSYSETGEGLNVKIPRANQLSIISDALYEAAKESWHSDFVNVDLNSTACLLNLNTIDDVRTFCFHFDYLRMVDISIGDRTKDTRNDGS